MIKLAVIGTSGITESFLSLVNQNPRCQVEAVYSRQMERAKAFARTHQISGCYCRLDELAADKNIQAVYIASPNSAHYTQVLQLLNAGKHILCEKSLGSNQREVLSMLQYAKERKLVLLEAMRTIHDPAFQIIKENLIKIGKVRKATLEFCQYSSRYNAFREGTEVNIFAKKCSAGALMDIGVYCVHALVELFGVPNSITAYPVLLRNGIDGAGTILTKYDSMIAELSYSKITEGCNKSQIQGENGTMCIEHIQNPKKIDIVYQSGEKESIELEDCKNNMQYEIDFFADAVEGKVDTGHFREVSLDAIKIMDKARAQMGVLFPADRPSGR